MLCRDIKYDNFDKKNEGCFTLEEQAAVRQLLDIQNDLDAHKAEVNREIHNEIGKELLKAIINLGRLR